MKCVEIGGATLYLGDCRDILPTIGRVSAVMHTLFQDAFMEERVEANPFARVPLLPERPVRRETLSEETLDRLVMTALESEPSGVTMAMALMGYQGRRVSEALGVHSDDFDLARSELVILRISDSDDGYAIRDGIKGRPAGLVLPLFQKMREVFERLRPKGFVSAGPDGVPLTRFQIRDAFERLEAKTGIHAHAHLLRATFATLAEEAGLSKEDVQVMLGHSTVGVTQRYIRRTAQPLVKKAAELGFMAGSLSVQRQSKKVVKLKQRGGK